MGIDLKALDISKEEIEDRIVNTVSEAILSSGGTTAPQSTFGTVRV